MVIFAEKHFSKNNAKVFSLAIHMAIYFRASLAILNRFIKFFLPFLVDFLIVLCGLFLLTNHWKSADIHFPEFVFKYSIPVYSATWLLSALFFGVYDKEPKRTAILKSTLFGTVLILLTYALLPKEWQFSRVFILIGALWVVSAHFLKSCMLNLIKHDQLKFQNLVKKNFILCGDVNESSRVEDLLNETYPNIGRIEKIETEHNLSSEITKLLFKESKTGFNELIFCAKNISPSEIIGCMNQLAGQELHFKIAQPDTSFIIGSDSIETKGDLYTMKINTIKRADNLRSKRLFDISVASFGLISSPLSVWFFKNKTKFLQNLIRVLRGQISIVGYCSGNAGNNEKKTSLPSLKKGLLNPLSGNTVNDHEIIDQVNINYAKEYSIIKDFNVLIKKWTYLDF